MTEMDWKEKADIVIDRINKGLSKISDRISVIPEDNLWWFQLGYLTALNMVKRDIYRVFYQ